ncbi:ankyrin repeat-containing domain protein [Xylariaceae sp. FL1272]|nr:ankyrin repeat-containing domain protein [Xylariaceae sp. FL1272]
MSGYLDLTMLVKISSIVQGIPNAYLRLVFWQIPPSDRHLPSFLLRRPSTTIVMTSDDWEQNKTIILTQYLLERLSLQDVASYMEENHGFTKKKSQYEYQLKKWGVKKNVSREFWQYAGYRINQRLPKKTKLTLFGVHLPETKVQKEILRYTTITTSSDFGKPPSSPVAPTGISFRLKSPSATSLGMPWPETLPWLGFNRRILPLLQPSSLLLTAFLSALGPSVGYMFGEFNNLVNESDSKGLTDPRRFQEALADLAKALPTDSIGRDARAEALTPNTSASSMAADLLKIMLFRLSNKMGVASTGGEKKIHDTFIIRFVETVSYYAPDILSTLLADLDVTSNAIKEEIYCSAIRQRHYKIVDLLLKAGVSPEYPITIWGLYRQGRIRKGMVVLKRPVDEYEHRWTGLQAAAYTCDGRLCKILLDAGANADSDPIETHLFNTNKETPLVWLAFGAGDFRVNSDDIANCARLLVKHGATANPCWSRMWRKCHTCRKAAWKSTPVEAAIASENSALMDFLVEEGASLNLRGGGSNSPTRPVCFCIPHIGAATSGLWTRQCTPLHLAILVQNTKVKEMLTNLVSQVPATEKSQMARELLITSCLVGDSALALDLMSMCSDLNGKWPLGITPLIATAWNTDCTISNRLLHLGVDIGPLHCNVNPVSVPTPLHVAAYHGNVHLVQCLIDRGVSYDVRLRNMPHDYCFLMSDIVYECKRGVHTTLTYPRRHQDITALQCAFVSKSVEATTILLNRSKLAGGELVQAISLGDQSLVDKIVRRGTDYTDFTHNGTTTVEAAVGAGNLELVSTCLRSGGPYSSKAMLIATRAALISKEYSIVNLLAMWHPRREIDQYEATCLVLALREGSTELARALLSESFLPGPASAELLRHPSFKHLNYLTPFLAALIGNDDSIIRLMLSRGFTVYPTDLEPLGLYSGLEERLRTQIAAAVFSTHWPAHCVKSMGLTQRQTLLLLAINLQDVAGVRKCIPLLESFDFELVVPAESAASTGFNRKHPYPSPLVVAAQIGNRQAFELLLNAGADINYQTSLGFTVLAETVFYNRANMFTMLLDRGVQVDPPIQLGERGTALQFAAITGNLVLAKRLIEYGADLNALPARSEGRTALEGAAESGKTDMVCLLLAHGAKIHGEMRIYYVRAIGFAKNAGHHALAEYLKGYGGWNESDQTLRDQPHTLNDTVFFVHDAELNTWHVRQMLYDQETDEVVEITLGDNDYASEDSSTFSDDDSSTSSGNDGLLDTNHGEEGNIRLFDDQPSFDQSNTTRHSGPTDTDYLLTDVVAFDYIDDGVVDYDSLFVEDYSMDRDIIDVT